MPPLCRHLHLRYIQIPEIAYNQSPKASSLAFLLRVSTRGGIFLPSFATSTLQNELLVIFDQQKVGFIRIFAAEIKKCKICAYFFDFSV